MVNKIRPARVFYDKLKMQYYIKNGKKKIYLPEFKNKKSQISIVNKIVNQPNLQIQRKRKRKPNKKTNIKIPNQPIGPVNPNINPSQSTFIRPFNEPFNLFLPNLISKFQSYDMFEKFNDQMKKLTESKEKQLLLEDKSLPQLEYKSESSRPQIIFMNPNFQQPSFSQPDSQSRVNISIIEPSEKKIKIETEDEALSSVDNLENLMEPIDDEKKEDATPVKIFINPIEKGFKTGKEVEESSEQKFINSFLTTPDFLKPNSLSLKGRSVSFPSYLPSVARPLPFEDLKSIDLKTEEEDDEEDQKLVVEEKEDENEEDEKKDNKRKLRTPVLTRSKSKSNDILPTMWPVSNTNVVYEAFDPTRFRNINALLSNENEVQKLLKNKKDKPLILEYTNESGIQKAEIFSSISDLINTLNPDTQTKNTLRSKLNQKKFNNKVMLVSGTEYNRLFNEAFKGNNFVIAHLSTLNKNADGSGKHILNLVKKNQKYNVPLYDSELVEMLSPYKDFVGVIMRDQLETLLANMIKEDRNKFGFIMNFDTTDMPGSHWVAIYIDLDEDKEINYYDSFARGIPKDILSILKQYVKTIGLPYYIKIKNNSIVQQKDDSNRCGYHSARFLIDRFKGRDFEDSTEFSVRKGEGSAAELEKSFRKFGYI